MLKISYLFLFYFVVWCFLTSIPYPAQKKSTTTSSRSSVKMKVISLHKYDVLLGRGRGFFRHHGNNRMREIAQTLKEKYRAARTAEKKFIVKLAIEMIRNIEGDEYRPKFLKLSDDETHYIEVSEDSVYQKVQHSLREGKTQILKEPATTATCRATVVDAAESTRRSAGRNDGVGSHRQGRRTVKLPPKVKRTNIGSTRRTIQTRGSTTTSSLAPEEHRVAAPPKAPRKPPTTRSTKKTSPRKKPSTAANDAKVKVGKNVLEMVIQTRSRIKMGPTASPASCGSNVDDASNNFPEADARSPSVAATTTEHRQDEQGSGVSSAATVLCMVQEKSNAIVREAPPDTQVTNNGFSANTSLFVAAKNDQSIHSSTTSLVRRRDFDPPRSTTMR